MFTTKFRGRQMGWERQTKTGVRKTFLTLRVQVVHLAVAALLGTGLALLLVLPYDDCRERA